MKWCLFVVVIVIIIFPVLIILPIVPVTRLPKNEKPTTSKYSVNTTIEPSTSFVTTTTTKCMACDKSEAGTRFTLAFMENNYTSFNHVLEIYPTKSCSLRNDTIINIAWSDGGNLSYYTSNFSQVRPDVVKNTLEVYRVPNTLQLTFLEKTKKAVVVKASNDIGVFAMNRHISSCDGFMVLPQHMLGTKHYVVSYFPSDKQTEFLFVAVDNNTSVKVHLQEKARPALVVEWQGKIYRGGEDIYFNLSSLDSVQLKANSDFSGSLVESDKPIAVFSGNDLTKVSIENDLSLNMDYLVEQIPSIEHWGLNFYLAPYVDVADYIAGYQVKIICSESETNITSYISNKRSLKFRCEHAGDVNTFFVNKTDGVVIKANKKILVMQIFESATRSAPAMVSITPSEKFNSYYNFPTALNDKYHRFNNTILIVAPTNITNSILLDEKKLDSTLVWNKFYENEVESEYSWVSVAVDEGRHELKRETSIGVFGVVILGSSSGAYFCSYAFSAGLCF